MHQYNSRLISFSLSYFRDGLITLKRPICDSFVGVMAVFLFPLFFL